jgi:hypothetical protein
MIMYDYSIVLYNCFKKVIQRIRASYCGWLENIFKATDHRNGLRKENALKYMICVHWKNCECI